MHIGQQSVRIGSHDRIVQGARAAGRPAARAV